MVSTTVARTPCLLLTEKDVARMCQQVLGCGRTSYRAFRREHLDHLWQPSVKKVFYERKNAAGIVVERGTRPMLSRMRSHDLEDALEENLGLYVRVVEDDHGVRTIRLHSDVE